MKKLKFLVISLAVVIILSAGLLVTFSQGEVTAALRNFRSFRLSNSIVPSVEAPFSSDRNDVAYCSGGNDYSCVYNGKCYSDSQKVNGAICLKPVLGSSLEPRAWYNCDDSDGYNDFCSFCGYGEQVKSGESRVGEYLSVGVYGCCGDDKNEFKKTGRDGSVACCNSKSDLVVNGKCYAKNKMPRAR